MNIIGGYMMKRVTQEPTDKNILESINTNSYQRNSNVLEFVKALDLIEGNMFISLNASWGQGKSFFVRQIEKTLEYYTKKYNKDNDDETNELNKYFEGTVLENIEMNNKH